MNEKIISLKNLTLFNRYIRGINTEPINEYLSKDYYGESEVGSGTPSLVVRFSCNIKAGDRVCVSMKATGVTTNKYDVRFYYQNQIYVLKTDQPLADKYYFTADRDYDECSLGMGTGSPAITMLGQGFVSVVNKNGIVDKAKEGYLGYISNELQGKNLYSITALHTGRCYKGAYEDIYTNITCTDYIPVIPGRKYAIYGGFNLITNNDYVNAFDKDKAYIGSLTFSTSLTTYDYTGSDNFAIFTAPTGCYFVRLNFLTQNLDNGTYRSYWYFADITNKKLATKKVLVLGDSISTDTYGNYKKWVTNLCEEQFFTKGFVDNNSIHATGFVAQYNSGNNSFLQRIQEITSPSSYDLVIIFGGINDFIQNVPFGTNEDSSSTHFVPAVNSFFDYLIKHFTQARIVVLSPLRTSNTSQNSVNKYQTDYDDYIKQVAKSYCLPILNLTEESGFCPFINEFKNMWTLIPSGETNGDGVHPNADYQLKYLAPQIKKFLKGIMK